MSTFSVPQAVARYAEAPLRQVPGFLALQQMSRLLLAERVPAQGRVLVLGAGGGLELKALPRRSRAGSCWAWIRPRRCWPWPSRHWVR